MAVVIDGGVGLEASKHIYCITHMPTHHRHHHHNPQPTCTASRRLPQKPCCFSSKRAARNRRIPFSQPRTS